MHRARDRDVEPVAQQQELEPTRGVAPRRRRERHDRDGRLLPLEPVDRADRHASEPGRRQRLLDRDLLRVVRRDDDDVGLRRAGAAASTASSVVVDLDAGPRRGRRDRARCPPRPAASSGDCVALPRCRTGTGMQPGATPVERSERRGRMRREFAAVRQARHRRRDRGCMRHVRARKYPYSGGMTSAPSMTQPSADVSTGSGWVPWLTWGSCCGSPSSSSREAARDTAMVEASENWPASSMTRRSRLPRGMRPSWLKSHAVPPITYPASACSAANSATPFLVIGVKAGRRRSGPSAPSRPARAERRHRRCGIEHVLDHGVRLRDDADLDSRARARAGRSRATRHRSCPCRRALHREVTAVEIDDGADDRIHVVAGGCGKPDRPLSLSKGARRRRRRMSVAGSSGSSGAAAITASAHASIATCWFSARGGGDGVRATGSCVQVTSLTAFSSTMRAVVEDLDHRDAVIGVDPPRRGLERDMVPGARTARRDSIPR